MPRLRAHHVLAVIAGLAALAAPAAARAQDRAPDAPAQSLQSALQAVIAASGYDIAFAVTDLQTGETFSVRGEEPRLTGCAINLLVLIQATLDIQDGLLALEDVDWLISRTIYVSDATTALELLWLLGGGDEAAGVARVRALAARLGLESAVYDHPPAFQVDFDTEIENVISAVDMNRLLMLLWTEAILAPEWTSYLLERMTHVYPGLQYLSATSGGADTIVSHKNGFYWTDEGYVETDVGIVRFWVDGFEHAYAASYFAANIPEEFEDVPAAQELFAVAWRYFAAEYGFYGAPLE